MRPTVLTVLPPPSAGHALASWLLGVVILLILIALVVELSMWRRFREIRLMFDRALNSGSSTDDAIRSVRMAERDTADRVTLLVGRVDRIDAEVQRLTAFYPPGDAPPRGEG